MEELERLLGLRVQPWLREGEKEERRGRRREKKGEGERK